MNLIRIGDRIINMDRVNEIRLSAGGGINFIFSWTETTDGKISHDSTEVTPDEGPIDLIWSQLYDMATAIGVPPSGDRDDARNPMPRN